MMTDEKMLIYYRDKRLKVQEAMSKIYEEVNEADERGGIEESCRVWAWNKSKMNFLIKKYEYFTENIKKLEERINNRNIMVKKQWSC